MHCSSKRSLRPDKRFDSKTPKKKQKQKKCPAVSYPSLFFAKDSTLELQQFVGHCVVISGAFAGLIDALYPDRQAIEHQVDAPTLRLSTHTAFCIIQFSRQTCITGKYGF
jgi:hypothetical protein